ncbi:MAG TPA: hypothetical protein VG871_03710 [Vicinamibacterales bacterium]|nr:hypothetical protein [Vicinamibacterales bacterium]
MVGGLLFAEFITLYLTPVVYTCMDAVLKWRAAAGQVRSAVA